jgi:hypothetical protein
MEAIVPHQFDFHFEMFGGVCEYFASRYRLHFFIPMANIASKKIIFDSWVDILMSYCNRRKFIAPIFHTDNIPSLRYELCIIPTDDDRLAYQVYSIVKQHNPNMRVFCINHTDMGNRNPLPPHLSVRIQGIWTQDFYANMMRYITTDEKMAMLSTERVRLLVMGDIIRTEKNFLVDLRRRISNFSDVDIFFLNRQPATEEISDPNIFQIVNCTTHTIFDILKRCHYVYFFSTVRGSNSSTAAFPLAFSTLCRMVCCERSRKQYHITSPLFYEMNDTFSLTLPTRQEIADVETERERLLQQTSCLLDKMLNQI